MPLGLQKQLGSGAVLDIWWSNLSFLGRFFSLCCADKALYRTTSCLNNRISPGTMSALLPFLICLTYSSLPEARERTGLFCWPSATGKIKAFFFAFTCGMTCRNYSRNQKPKELALTSLALLGTLLPSEYLQPL